MQQMREVQLANGFSAQGDRRLLFGLGEYSGPVAFEIKWYGAETQMLSNLALDRYHSITYEGQRFPQVTRR
jgi:hypothetical protein